MILALVVSCMYLTYMLSHKFEWFFINPNVDNITAWAAFLYIVSVNTEFQLCGAGLYITSIVLFIINHIRYYCNYKRN